MSQTDNPFAAPESQTYAPLLSDSAGEGVWREGNLLVMLKKAELPDRCIKCNASTNGYKLKRSLYWHPPLVYAMLILSPLIYIVLALIFRHTAVLHVGLCDVHRAKRRNAILTAWLIFFAGIGIFFLTSMVPEGIVAIVILAGIFCVFGSIVYGMLRARTITPSKIDKQYAWIKGAHADYLESLPATS